MTTRRQRVLAYLRKHPRVSAGQIGRSLGLSASVVRHHLSVLAGDGRISPAGTRRVPARGRPETLFRVSDALLGDNVAGLADLLLEISKRQAVSAARPQLFRSIGAGLARRLGSLAAQGPELARLNSLVDRLGELHYEARWEAGAEGPRLVFGRCPYAQLVERHPELCGADSEMLQAATGQVMHQHAKIGDRASLVCIFSRAAPDSAQLPGLPGV